MQRIQFTMIRQFAIILFVIIALSYAAVVVTKPVVVARPVGRPRKIRGILIKINYVAKIAEMFRTLIVLFFAILALANGAVVIGPPVVVRPVAVVRPYGK
ncbi:hypothetical protein PRIPAC_80023 [Pristionchus pacificus]|uniref:Uncharacterized protein n=1 Tax=Pristionchus pacificus TaxID=54126 RepID=A0A2A6BHN0_PRIPA|nr:hypothetical protein PRIPAC_80023 [Pristionchus pacificus]|eukprot:PDM65363.1 hypothetical protein PRIPAC_52305 [Pristionchus pacificus]